MHPLCRLFDLTPQLRFENRDLDIINFQLERNAFQLNFFRPESDPFCVHGAAWTFRSTNKNSYIYGPQDN